MEYKDKSLRLNNEQATIRLEKEEMEAGEYILRIDYEAYDTSEAYQIGKKLIIGHKPLIDTSTLIYARTTTNELLEEDVDTEEYLETNYYNWVGRVTNKTTGEPVSNLSFDVYLSIGDDLNYYDDANLEQMRASFNTALKSPDTVTTDENGRFFYTLNARDFWDETNVTTMFSATSKADNTQSTNGHTLFFVCEGTTDRGDDNYLPCIYPVPVRLSTSKVAQTVNFTPNTDGSPTVGCGGGFRFDVITKMGWHNTTDSEESITKIGYESYDTDNTKWIYEGKIEIEEYDTDLDTWTPVLESQIDPISRGCGVSSNMVLLPVTSELFNSGYYGTLSFNLYNYFDNSFNGTWQIRYRYVGVAGYTYTSDWVEVDVDVNDTNESYSILSVINLPTESNGKILLKAKRNATITPVIRNSFTENLIVEGTLEYTIRDTE